MAWNLRFVVFEDELTLEPYMELREVFYDENGLPMGHARATVGGNNMEEITQYLDRALEATTNPVLRDEDFDYQKCFNPK
jgi:hypothetical protein